MNNYWLSWYHPPGVGFELHWPWWVTGMDGYDNLTICAAVRAESEDSAKAIVLDSLDEAIVPEWRFCSPKPHGWSPFGERFPRAEWMEWAE